MVESNLKGALCYFNVILPFGVFASLYFAFVNKNDKFATFHAWQSLALTVIALIVGVLFGGLSALTSLSAFAFGPGALAGSFAVVGLASLASLILLIAALVAFVKALQNEKFELPVIGKWAAQQANA